MDFIIFFCSYILSNVHYYALAWFDQIIFALMDNSYANYVSICFSVSAMGLTFHGNLELHKLQSGSNP